MNPLVESAWIAAGAAFVGVVGTATVGIVGYVISHKTNRETLAAAKATTDETIVAARETNQATIDAAHADVLRTLDTTRDGQLADRYSKAIEQLGSSTIDVTIGGIYALERIARDSPTYHPTVMEVLAACIREHSPQQWPEPERGGPPPERSTRPDIQAALTVIGRRDSEPAIEPIDLTDANLTRARIVRNFSGAYFTRAILCGADLTAPHLTSMIGPADGYYDVDLTGAILRSADLSFSDFSRVIHAVPDRPEADLIDAIAYVAETGASAAYFDRTSLTGADLCGAFLTGADLTGASLVFAVLTRADLTGAILIEANLAGADLSGANLSGAKLFGANLFGADLTAHLTGAVFTGAILTGARWGYDAPVPEGWELDADSHRLRRAGIDSGAATTN